MIVRELITKLGYKVDSAKLAKATEDVKRFKKQANTTAKSVVGATNKIAGGFDKVKQHGHGMHKANTEGMSLFGKAVTRTGEKIDGFAMKMMTITMTIFAVKTAINFVISGAVRFEQSMADLRAVVQPTAKDFKLLEQEARKLGKTTVFTASQVAEAFKELGKLGLKTNQIIGASVGVLNLAAGSNATMAEAALVTATTMKQFGLEAKDAIKITDTMAKAFTLAPVEMQSFSDAMKFAGIMAKRTGVSLAETTAMISALSEEGMRGQMAGTGLRRVLFILAKSTGPAAKKLKELGVGAAAPLREKLKALKPILQDISQAQKMFGDRGAVAASILSGATDKVASWTEQLKWAKGGSLGFAAAMAKIKLDTLAGDTKLLISAFEGFQIALGKLTGGALRLFIQGLTSIVRGMEAIVSLSPAVVGALNTIMDLLILIGPLALAIFGMAFSKQIIFMGWALKYHVVVGLQAVKAGFIKAAIASKAFVASNPLLLGIAATVGLIAFTWKKVADNIKEANDAIDRQALMKSKAEDAKFLNRAIIQGRTWAVELNDLRKEGKGSTAEALKLEGQITRNLREQNMWRDKLGMLRKSTLPPKRDEEARLRGVASNLMGSAASMQTSTTSNTKTQTTNMTNEITVQVAAPASGGKDGGTGLSVADTARAMKVAARSAFSIELRKVLIAGT